MDQFGNPIAGATLLLLLLMKWLVDVLLRHVLLLLAVLLLLIQLYLIGTDTPVMTQTRPSPGVPYTQTVSWPRMMMILSAHNWS